MVDEASLGQPNKHRPVVDPLLEVGWKVAFIDDLDLYSGYRVFPNIADLGGLERKRERCQTSAPDETLKDRLNLKPSSTQQNVPRVNFICCLHPHLRGNSQLLQELCLWVGAGRTHRSNTGPFKRKGVTELFLRSLTPVTARLLLPGNPAVLGGWL